MKKFMGSTEERIAARRKLLGNPYAGLNDTGGIDGMAPRKIANNNTGESKPTTFLSRRHNPSGWIEKKARDLQVMLWNERNTFWPEGVPSDTTKLLDPSKAINCIGYDYDLSEYLGEFHDESSQVAGIIDRKAKRISISRRLPYNTLRFTAAHELGHAVLHSQAIMHRDRPLDGSAQNHGSREPMEIEADKFAAYFLMPDKLVRQRFNDIFDESQFMLSEHTAFALDPSDPQGIIAQCTSSRDLAIKLAKADHYNGRHVRSLATQFGVSITAMAIRLEELGMIS